MTREVDRLRTLVRIFDELIRIPGTNVRVGLDPLMGILPGGDAIGGVFAAWTIITAGRLGAPVAVITRMLLNVLTDTLVGSIPLAGDLFDVGYKANRRNLDLLEHYLQSPGRARASSWAVVGLALLVLIVVVAGAIALAAWLTRQLISLL